jgi:hypothetical protein
MSKYVEYSTPISSPQKSPKTPDAKSYQEFTLKCHPKNINKYSKGIVQYPIHKSNPNLDLIRTSLQIKPHPKSKDERTFLIVCPHKKRFRV